MNWKFDAFADVVDIVYCGMKFVQMGVCLDVNCDCFLVGV